MRERNKEKLGMKMNRPGDAFRFTLRQTLWGLLGFFLLPIGSSFADLECRLLYHIEQGYLNQHIIFDSENKNLEQRTVDQVVKKLDSSKIYLLKSDVEQIRNLMAGIFGKLKGTKTEPPNCSPLVKAQEILVKRV